MRARNFRVACGPSFSVGNAAGISSEMREPCCRCLWTAKSAPPALTFRIEPRSRKSLPSGSAPRTNTGIASGNRGDLRRSSIPAPRRAADLLAAVAGLPFSHTRACRRNCPHGHGRMDNVQTSLSHHPMHPRLLIEQALSYLGSCCAPRLAIPIFSVQRALGPPDRPISLLQNRPTCARMPAHQGPIRLQEGIRQ